MDAETPRGVKDHAAPRPGTDVDTTPRSQHFVRAVCAAHLLVAVAALCGCSTPDRDRHFALRAEAVAPQLGSGVALTERLPVEGLLVEATSVRASSERLNDIE
ncbi:MAG: hypothetical protein EA379_02000 [Phycisphaerales bacterium]|nr:MAG: hypothetical protein EA379_02000 [Phycisphaerales bacterium]